jgi:hypothetical protein
MKRPNTARRDPTAVLALPSRRDERSEIMRLVLSSMTEHAQRVYDLRFVQQLSTREIAEDLGISCLQIELVQCSVARGFHALVLAREGRAYCPKLARIDDVWAFTGDNFSSGLHQAIDRHLSERSHGGDNCTTCRKRLEELLDPYAP